MSDLSALLDREAGAEIEGILSEARQRASEIADEAQREAEQLLAQRRRTAETQREATLVRAQSAARLEASAVKLRAQHAAVASVFDAAKEQLSAMAADPSRYTELLKSLMTEAVDALGGASAVATVQVAPSDVGLAGEVAKAIGVEAKVVASEAVSGGVRLTSKDRSVVENTLSQRLEALEGELASRVSSLLFGDVTEA